MGVDNSSKLYLLFAGEEFPSLQNALFPFWHGNKWRSSPSPK